jgi:hypothetical protein
MKTEASLVARGKIDGRLNSLEDFAFSDGEAVNNEEIDGLSNLLCTFHTGRETRARFATLVHIERVKKAMPAILGQHIPRFGEPIPQLGRRYRGCSQSIVEALSAR